MKEQESTAASSEETSTRQLYDEVIRGLWQKGGRACVADLANDLESPTSAKALAPVVEQLEREGIVQKVSDPKDPRHYETPYQTVYELKR